MPLEDGLHGYFRIGDELYLVKNFQGGGFTRLHFVPETIDADPDAIYEIPDALKDIPSLILDRRNSIHVETLENATPVHVYNSRLFLQGEISFFRGMTNVYRISREFLDGSDIDTAIDADSFPHKHYR
jgi:hypothetical protein